MVDHTKIQLDSRSKHFNTKHKTTLIVTMMSLSTCLKWINNHPLKDTVVTKAFNHCRHFEKEVDEYFVSEMMNDEITKTLFLDVDMDDSIHIIKKWVACSDRVFLSVDQLSSNSHAAHSNLEINSLESMLQSGAVSQTPNVIYLCRTVPQSPIGDVCNEVSDDEDEVTQNETFKKSDVDSVLWLAAIGLLSLDPAHVNKCENENEVEYDELMSVTSVVELVCLEDTTSSLNQLEVIISTNSEFLKNNSHNGTGFFDGVCDEVEVDYDDNVSEGENEEAYSIRRAQEEAADEFRRKQEEDDQKLQVFRAKWATATRIFNNVRN